MRLTSREESPGFVGRSEELQAARALFDEGARLVTLIGPGGVGKTRLARRLGAVLCEEDRDRDVVFCDLTEARSLEGATAVVAEALGVGLAGTRDTTSAVAEVGRALAARGPSLVVADNFEQLQSLAKDTLGRWQKDAPEARFLVTSRQPLGLDGERRLELPPLSLEDARALFLARANAARPGFSVDDDGLLAAVLARLDRLPLAIELAAARLEVLSLAQLEARLSQSLQLLRRPERAGGRHDAIAAALEWSWQLLEGMEQAALAQVAVFVGGFSLEAAEAVVRLGAQGADVLDVLQSLKRKSLLEVVAPAVESAPLRFRLLETVRAFALEKLEERGETAEAITRHARCFVEAADALIERTPEAYARLSPEAENLAAAHERMLAREPALAALAALGLDALLTLSGPVEARLRFLTGAVAASQAAGDERLLSRVRTALSEAARTQGRLDVAEREAEEALSLGERGEDDALVGDALSALGTVHVFRGQYARAREVFVRALGHLDDDERRRARGVVLMRLFGAQLVEGRFQEAEPVGREALEVLREVGDGRSHGITLANLGVLYAELGRRVEAAAFYEEALSVYAKLGDRRSESMLLANRGVLALDDEALDEALALLESAARIARELQDLRLESYATGCIGITQARRGEMRQAREALETGRRLAERRGDPVDRALFLAYRAGVDAVLGSHDTARAACDEVMAELGQLGNRVMEQAVERAAAAARLRIETGTERGGARERAIGLLKAPSLGIHARLSCRWLEEALSPAAAPEQGARPSAPAPSVALGSESLTLSEDGFVFRVGAAEPVDLSRRGPMRRVLRALVDARLAHPGRTLDVHALLEAGWPGEKVLPEAGANRVYAAIKTLRKLGLEGILMTRDDGYLLSPDVDVALG